VKVIIRLAFIILLASINSGYADNRIINIGIYDNPPKVFMSEDGRPSGIFIDIIEHIASLEGWTLRYTPGTWAEGLQRLKSGEIDLMPDVAGTADREALYSFHRVPVLSSWSQIYARSGHGIQSILDLDRKKIAVLEGSVQQKTFGRFTESLDMKITLIPVADYKTMFEITASGRVDAGLTNRFYGLMNAKKQGLVDTAVIFEPAALFFAAPLNSQDKVLEAIDRHLAAMKSDTGSEYYVSLKRWTSEEVEYQLPDWLKAVGSAAVIILLLSLAGSFILKQQVNFRTRDLQLTNKELELRIAEQKETERALHDSELKYRELVELANSIILRWTHEGLITFLNEFGQKFFGYSPDEIIGKHVVGTIVPEIESSGMDMRRLLQMISADPPAFEQNINENVKRNGQRVWIAWTNKLVTDELGAVTGILSVGTDITALKKAEAEVRELNTGLERRVIERTAELAVARDEAQAADRIKSAFLATMSHELRTPLNSIIGFTGIILQHLAGPLNPEQTKQMGMVRNSARHLLALINDVLDISKIEAGQLQVYSEQFDPREVLESAVSVMKPLADKKGLSLNLNIGADVAGATGDRRRVEQVMLNLISNSIKYSERGGVTIDVFIVSGYVFPDGTSAGAIFFRVSDTGIGISPDDLKNLFQPFRQIDTGLTRKNEGTGLGLAICRRLSELMRGEITAVSEPGRGSVFTFILPLTGVKNNE
jgi:PAS domain S-box-containing protein